VEKYGNLLKMLCVVISLLVLICGCAKSEQITIYVINGSAIEEKTVSTSGVDYQSIVNALKENGVLPENTVAQDFKNNVSGEVRSLEIDFGIDFLTYLNSIDGEAQRNALTCVVNTFIKCFNATTVKVTANGNILLTADNDFSYSYSYGLIPVNVNGGEITVPVITVEPTATPTPTVEPTATAKATAKTTSYPTNAPNAVTRTAIPKLEGTKYVALSFDDGPSEKYTKLIVDKLNEYHASASFFIVGSRVNQARGEAMKYAADNGCEVQIHGWSHEGTYTSYSLEQYYSEMEKTKNIIIKYTGVTPTLMRPFGGTMSVERVGICPYPVILWDVDSNDWRHKSDGQIDTIVNNVMSEVKEGSIILMHEIYENSYQAFLIIMEKLYQQGYQVVSVTDLLNTKLKAGTRYYSYTSYRDCTK